MKQKQCIGTGRVLPLLICAVFCLMQFVPSLSPKAESTVSTVSNIVLFAQFSHEEGYNFMTEERTGLLVDGLTRTDTVNSLYGYINAISYGQTETACYFPQMNGNTITPYTLSQSLESYSREALALEIIRNVGIPSDIPLDCDNDGYIDNFILIVDGEAASQQDTLWQHMSSLAYAGAEINGKKADSYNLICSGNLFGSVVNPFNTGVVCHEFLHSLGYPDLYHGSGSADETPVGVMWDIMAGSLNSNPVAPLAYMRASRSGWLETEQITKNGTYTLSPASSDSGSRVFLLKTPASATEFFAVEFRQQGETLKSLDGICNSGLLVYRVNTTADGNHNGDTDEIYLFRPQNDSSTGQANYGGEGREDCIGSLNPTDGIADGALTFSNGVNSGIRIENITINGDTLTFDVQLAEISEVAAWRSIPGETGLDGALDIAVSENGTVWLAGTKSYSTAAGLCRLSEAGCEPVADYKASGSIYEVQLAVAGETPYMLYKDAEFRAVLCAYDIASDTWQTLWKSEALAQYTDIAANGNQVFVCYTVGDYPAYNLRILCFAEGEMTQLGSSISKSGCLPSLVCTDEAVAVAYRDLGDNNLPKLALFEEESWTHVSLSDTACSQLYAASDGKSLTVAVTGSSAALYRYENGTLTGTPYPALPGSPLYVYPLYVDGSLLAAVYTQNDFSYSLCRCDGGWEMLGSCIEAQAVVSPCIAASKGTMYTAYQLGSSPAVIVKTLQYGGSLPGDVNADGSFTVLDAVALQKWLLGAAKSLPDGKAGDFDGNGILDVIDLCLMKRALLGI